MNLSLFTSTPLGVVGSIKRFLKDEKWINFQWRKHQQ